MKIGFQEGRVGGKVPGVFFFQDMIFFFQDLLRAKELLCLEEHFFENTLS